MPETEITLSRFTRSGLDMVGADAAFVVDDGDGLLLLRNDGLMVIVATGPGQLTIHKGANVGDATFEPDEHTLGSNPTGFGPFPPALYNDSSGNVAISADANVQVYGLRI